MDNKIVLSHGHYSYPGAITCYWVVEITQNFATRLSIEVEFKFHKKFCEKGS